MRRRDFLTLVGAAAAFPNVAFAQQPIAKRMGVLIALDANDPGTQPRIDAVWAGLAKQGWSQNNLQADFRYGAATFDAARQPAAELLALKPDVLFAAAGPATLAFAGLTKTTPVVFAYINGALVSSALKITDIGHPGGNVTGFTATDETELRAKQLDLIREMLPGATRAALIYNPDSVAGGETAYLNEYTSLAATAHLQLVPYPVRTPMEISDALKAVASDRTLGLLMSEDAFITVNRAMAIAVMAQLRLWAVWLNLYEASDGGLIAIGSNVIAAYGGAGEYAGLILNGANPGDLPIQIPPIMLAVNLNTAKALGVSLPASVLVQADQVIQ